MIVILILSGLIIRPASALTEDYGIIYSGGEPLGEENIQIDPDLKLSAVVRGRDENGNVTYGDVVFSDSEKWEQGFMRASGDRCLNVTFLR